jgi:hypothetical protein
VFRWHRVGGTGARVKLHNRCIRQAKRLTLFEIATEEAIIEAELMVRIPGPFGRVEEAREMTCKGKRTKAALTTNE